MSSDTCESFQNDKNNNYNDININYDNYRNDNKTENNNDMKKQCDYKHDKMSLVLTYAFNPMYTYLQLQKMYDSPKVG